MGHVYTIYWTGHVVDVEEHDQSLSSIASSFRWCVTIPAAAGMGGG